MPKVVVEIGGCRAYCSPSQVKEVGQQLRDIPGQLYAAAAQSMVDFAAETHLYAGACLNCPLSDLHYVTAVLRQEALEMPKGGQ